MLCLIPYEGTYTFDVEGGKFKLSVGGLVTRLEHIRFEVGDA